MTALSIPERAREIAAKIHAHNATYSRSERDRNDLLILSIQHALEDEREALAVQVNAILQRNAVSRDKAKEAGRHGVSDCRQSNVETCEEILKLLREGGQK